MSIRFPAAAAAGAFASITFLSAFQTGRKPEDEFAGVVKAYLGMGLPSDWDGLEKIPHIKWAKVAPTMLKNCLPNGDCFSLQGTATVGGRSMIVLATGARTMVFNLLFRNSAPMGEPVILAALKQAGLTADLVRCPIREGAGGTNWFRIKGEKLTTGHLSIQPAAAGRSGEGFILSQGEKPAALQPNQLALYTEQCAAGAERKPVSTLKPHQLLAQTVVALLAQAGGPAHYDWKALAALPTEIAWDTAGPKSVNLMTLKNDPNPLMQSGTVTYAGRTFSLMASGTPALVKNIYLEEGGMHPRGEHMLGVVYEKGIAVKLVRCGPIYTESTNNWYSLTSAKTRTAMILQSIRYEGNQVQDSYALRLDGSLPTRDSRDRNPGANGC